MENFLGTAGQFSDLEIKRLEFEHTALMHQRATELIERGFLDSDYDGSDGEYSVYGDNDTVSVSSDGVDVESTESSDSIVVPETESVSEEIDLWQEPLDERETSDVKQPNYAPVHYYWSDDESLGNYYAALFAEAEGAFDSFQDSWAGLDAEHDDEKVEELENYERVIEVDYTVYEMMDDDTVVTIEMTVHQETGCAFTSIMETSLMHLLAQCFVNALGFERGCRIQTV